jgi:hypothetical protein
MFEKSYEASERTRRIEEEAVADRELHEGAPPEKSLGERLRGWWQGRRRQRSAGGGGDDDSR